MQPSHWDFKRYGQSGLEVSDLFPQVGGVADELCMIRGMTAKFSEHAQGNFFMHTGFPFLGFPSAGAWTSYGLGTESRDLPGYVVLQSGGASTPHGGVGLFSNGFLPAQHQASIVKADEAEAVANIRARQPRDMQRKQLDFIGAMDRRFVSTTQHDMHVEAAISNYEMAWRMQSAVPDLCDISGETEVTRKLYGLDDPEPKKAAYARQCLLARRLVERGVRFIELSTLAYNVGGGNGSNPWDHHSALNEGHGKMGNQIDQPIAALIKDLRSRGLLDSTLVVWAGEFGRTPFAQGSNGRDHNPYGFTVWMAGGGVKGGHAYGATDDFGYNAVENISSVYDMWATVLHLMGIDHKQLTYRFSGRDLRLTDVHGNVLKDIIA
ncbi:MAG: sulfatase [Chthoniobacter sp. 12-60-6]|nr:MAG: sulfatase [Chthoniobacter sp. 12-60-6]